MANKAFLYGVGGSGTSTQDAAGPQRILGAGHSSDADCHAAAVRPRPDPKKAGALAGYPASVHLRRLLPVPVLCLILVNSQFSKGLIHYGSESSKCKRLLWIKQFIKSVKA